MADLHVTPLASPELTDGLTVSPGVSPATRMLSGLSTDETRGMTISRKGWDADPGRVADPQPASATTAPIMMKVR